MQPLFEGIGRKILLEFRAHRGFYGLAVFRRGFYGNGGLPFKILSLQRVEGRGFLFGAFIAFIWVWLFFLRAGLRLPLFVPNRPAQRFFRHHAGSGAKGNELVQGKIMGRPGEKKMNDGWRVLKNSRQYLRL